MMLLESFVIGLPSFMLTFEPNTKPISGNFLPQVLKRSIPRALLMLINVMIIIVLFNYQGDGIQLLQDNEYYTLAVLVMTYTGFLNLAGLCWPISLLKALTVGISFVGTTCAIIALPKFFNITTSSLMVFSTFFAIILVSIILIVLVKLNQKRLDKLRERIIRLLQKS